ncbi:MAG: hypothetical protein LBM59_04075 [Ruminococcus sp.]|jgi:hypothetical protein|nr:hypothetical protein [Ruminococcus sp.]
MSEFVSQIATSVQTMTPLLIILNAAAVFFAVFWIVRGIVKKRKKAAIPKHVVIKDSLKEDKK